MFVCHAYQIPNCYWLSHALKLVLISCSCICLQFLVLFIFEKFEFFCWSKIQIHKTYESQWPIYCNFFHLPAMAPFYVLMNLKFCLFLSSLHQPILVITMQTTFLYLSGKTYLLFQFVTHVSNFITSMCMATNASWKRKEKLCEEVIGSPFGDSKEATNKWYCNSCVGWYYSWCYWFDTNIIPNNNDFFNFWMATFQDGVGAFYFYNAIVEIACSFDYQW